MSRPVERHELAFQNIISTGGVTTRMVDFKCDCFFKENNQIASLVISSLLVANMQPFQSLYKHETWE